MICPVCHAPPPHAGLPAHKDPFGGKTYLLYRCQGCGAAFCDPMENPGPAWYARAAAVWTPARRPEVPAWRLEGLRRLKAENPGPASLLEIGCSDGSFLLEARKLGFEVYGVDFDAEATARARADGLSGVTTGFFEDFAAKSARKYDVIVFFQTLEHLTDPRRFLAEVRGLLAPGGHILFDIPDADRPMPGGSGLIDLPPHHLTRWSARTVKKFLADGGFDITCLESMVTYRILRDAAGSSLAETLGGIKRALSGGGAARGGQDAALPAAQPATAASPSAAFRLFDLTYRCLLAPLAAPLFLAWLAVLRLGGRGFYIFCGAKARP
ncbi:MAG: hypothetical protein A2X35_01990 [Elusimicrobia bacterium GWA2_61_42]|nr:MAG: hypothetical protein A2X35_01990 [Elusimicrobia bacterium GWA2_61_42]OGR78706.1 MAG: hypothetical protein A2X38_03930 [Elusimicrobia bacterium GWC2_61_25]